MLKEAQTAATDVHIVHTELEWQVAKAIARALDAHGYTVAPTRTLELPDRRLVNTLPADARAVIVIWPIARTDFGMPALELEARAAAQRGNLVQIYAGAVRPSEVHAGAPPVDFNGWDHASTGKQWRALLQRLRPLSGPPPTRPLDTIATTQHAVLAGTFVAACGAALFALSQSGHNQEQLVAPATPIAQPDLVAAGVTLRAAIAKHPRPEGEADAGKADATDFGGPDGYDADLGIDGADPRLAPQPSPPPPPTKRPAQGPEM